MRVLAKLNGTLLDFDAPQINVDDLGLLRGDGVFETILVVDGQPRELEPHLARLVRSAAILELPAPDLAQWRSCVDTVIANWQGGSQMALKLVLTRGRESDGTLTAFAIGDRIADKVLSQREQGISVVTLDRGVDTQAAERAPWLLLGAKSLSYAVNMAALREAGRRGADDVIFTSANGYVFEGPTSSTVLVQGRTLRTPPAAIGILPGTTQAALFRAAERVGFSVKVEPIRVSELSEADGVFQVSSVRAITRVHTLDGVALPNSATLHAELVGLYESEY